MDSNFEAEEDNTMRRKPFGHRTPEYYQKQIKRRAASRYPSPGKKTEEIKNELPPVEVEKSQVTSNVSL